MNFAIAIVDIDPIGSNFYGPPSGNKGKIKLESALAPKTLTGGTSMWKCIGTISISLLFIVLYSCQLRDRSGQPLLDGSEIEVLSSDIAQMQFQDLPVPADFTIQKKSYGSSVGTFRMGELNYVGTSPTTKVVDYLSSRLPLHGWSLMEKSQDEGQKVNLVYRKGNTRAAYTIWREDFEASDAQQGYRPAAARIKEVTKIMISLSTGRTI